MNGGRFDFDDGGTFCGGWEEGKAHGHGVCTGPGAQGEYAGAWHYGFEVSGVYTWPSGSTYMGQWQNGKRHGLGLEQRGRWLYKGEWTQGFKGRYGRREALNSGAHYLGTWSSGLHDGYGAEVYADGGSYKGQWLRGMRHGYGIRVSAQFGVASKQRSGSANTHASLTSLRSNYGDEDDELMDTIPASARSASSNKTERVEIRSGFVLKARSAVPTKRRRSLSERSLAVKRTILSGLRIKKQHSTGDIHQRSGSVAGSIRSSGSTLSCMSNESGEAHHHHHHHHHHNFEPVAEEKIEPAIVETYKGEWKNDVRSGYGLCDRSDGLRYAGEWQENKKHGYGITYFRDGTKEEGRYKQNVLVSSTRKRGLVFTRTSKLRELVEIHSEHARRAAEIAVERVDIALSRTMTAQERADVACGVAERARDDADTARIYAAQFDPTFRQPGVEIMRRSRSNRALPYTTSYQHTLPQMPNHVGNHVSFESDASVLQQTGVASTSYAAMRREQPSFAYHPNPNLNGQTKYHHSPRSPRGELISAQQQSPLQAHSSSSTSNLTAVSEGGGTVPQHEVRVDVRQPSTSSHNYSAMPSSSSTVHFSPTGSHQHLHSAESAAGAGFEGVTGPQQSSYSQSSNTHDVNQRLRPSGVSKGGGLVGNSLPLGGAAGMGNSPTQLRTNRGRAGGGQSSTVSMSDDHFDQYSMRREAANNSQAMSPIPSSAFSPATSSIINPMGASGSSVETSAFDEGTIDEQAPRLRRNRPSLIKQFEVNDIAILNRRSTLATSSRQNNPRPALPADDAQASSLLYSSMTKGEGERGSLPNLDELISQGVQLKREEASVYVDVRRDTMAHWHTPQRRRFRLASQRRLENQRLNEEAQLLHSNPLRYLLHPSFRVGSNFICCNTHNTPPCANLLVKNWLIRWRLPLLLLLGNFLLLYYLVHLLTTQNRDVDDGSGGGVKEVEE